MAVKVLEKKKLSYITTCKECGSRIQCDEADLETDVLDDFLDYTSPEQVLEAMAKGISPEEFVDGLNL